MMATRWVAYIMVLSVMVVACSREVHETHEYKRVEPNVSYAPPLNVAPAEPQPSPTPQPAPAPQPYQPDPTPQPAPAPQPYQPDPTPQPAPAPAPDPATAQPAWANQTAQVTGQSAVDPNRAHNPAQAKLMARRGAKLDAMRNLLEQVLGLRLSSTTTVRDMVTAEDKIVSESNGYIRDARITGEHFDGQIYTVNMQMGLYNVYTYMKTKKVYYK